MANMFIGDNDHGDTPLPPLSDLLWAEVTKLRQDKVRLEEDIVHFANELNEVTHQRDYARQLYCSRISTVTSTYVESKRRTPEQISHEMGWDCYKETTNEN